MTRRNRDSTTPPSSNRKPDGQKNVQDPGTHPMAITSGGQSTRKRRCVSGDGGMRLPHEHDETGDRQETAGDTDDLLERAADDAMSDRVDTDRRGDAVEVFDRNTPRAGKR